MWIPYFLLEFWEPETPVETTQASEQDTSEREFEVYFYLENPPTRRRDVELHLTETAYRTQTDGTGRTAAVRFDPTADKLLERVGFKIKDVSARAAFRYCYDKLCLLLSGWALMTGSGFSIFGLLIADDRHKARWKVIPQRAAAKDFMLPAELSLSPQHSAAVSLYREGRNAQSPFYRFLCCYKILEAWYQGGGIFAEADRLVRARGLPVTRPRRTVTRDMLVRSLVFAAHNEFEGVSFANFFELLGPWRVRVAHAITDAGEFLNLDLYESQIALGPIANLTDMVARQVLLDEFDLWAAIREAPGPQEPQGERRG